VAAVTVYRLEAERAGGGPHLFPRPFGSVDEACAFAERNIDQLAGHYGWRVRGFRVLELPSMRVVTTVVWHDPFYDPDPFGQVLPLQGDTAGPALENTLPSAEAWVDPGPGRDRAEGDG
jgi:hypothetical protein